MGALGERLRARRVELGIGVRELARRVDLSPTYLSRLMTGAEESPPSEASLLRLAEALDLPIDDLLWLAQRVPGDVVEALLADRDLWRVVRYLRRKDIAGSAAMALLAEDRAAQIRALFSEPDAEFAGS